MSSISYRPHSPELQRGFRAAELWNDDLLTDYLERWARETPDKPAMVVPGGPSVTYAEMLDRARRVANALGELGLSRGDVIAIQLPSPPDFLIA
jgi:non-ribosomal peptide synthetase component E (peptide arylation enzyme)